MCEDYINNELDEKKFMPSDRETFSTIKDLLSDNINNVRVKIATKFIRKFKVEHNVVTTQIEPHDWICLLYTSPSPRDRTRSRMPSSA